jgi:hypothetical protein
MQRKNAPDKGHLRDVAAYLLQLLQCLLLKPSFLEIVDSYRRDLLDDLRIDWALDCRRSQRAAQ